jgi:hypothetical protein
MCLGWVILMWGFLGICSQMVAGSSTAGCGANGDAGYLSCHTVSFRTVTCDFHMHLFGLLHSIVASGKTVRIRAEM